IKTALRPSSRQPTVAAASGCGADVRLSEKSLGDQVSDIGDRSVAGRPDQPAVVWIAGRLVLSVDGQEHCRGPDARQPGAGALALRPGLFVLHCAGVLAVRLSLRLAVGGPW